MADLSREELWEWFKDLCSGDERIDMWTIEESKQAEEQIRKLIQRKSKIKSEPGGLKPGEYMHEWLKEDAVEFDLPTEEIIGALARDNELLKDKLDALIQRKVGREFVRRWTRFINKCDTGSAMQCEYIVREILKEFNIKVED